MTETGEESQEGTSLVRTSQASRLAEGLTIDLFATHGDALQRLLDMLHCGPSTTSMPESLSPRCPEFKRRDLCMIDSATHDSRVLEALRM